MEFNKSLYQLIISMIIWGTLGLMVLKSGLGSIDIAFFRCLFGILLLVPYCWYQGFIFNNNRLALNTIFLTLLGGIFIVLNWVLLFQSFKWASITLGNVSYYVQPVFLVIIGRFFFKEDVSFIKWIFILLTLCGVIMTMDVSVYNFHTEKKQLWGVFCALGAGLCYSFATLIAKNIKGIAPAMMTLLQLLIGTVILFPFIKLTLIQFTPIIVFYILTLGIVHTTIAFVLYYQSVKNLPTTTIAAISYIDPIVAVLTDVLFFNRNLGLIQIAGIMLTLSSSYFVINPKAIKNILYRKKKLSQLS